jgi:hypothetical protein
LYSRNIVPYVVLSPAPKTIIGAAGVFCPNIYLPMGLVWFALILIFTTLKKAPAQAVGIIQTTQARRGYLYRTVHVHRQPAVPRV